VARLRFVSTLSKKFIFHLIKGIVMEETSQNSLITTPELKTIPKRKRGRPRKSTSNPSPPPPPQVNTETPTMEDQTKPTVPKKRRHVKTMPQEERMKQIRELETRLETEKNLAKRRHIFASIHYLKQDPFERSVQYQKKYFQQRQDHIQNKIEFYQRCLQTIKSDTQ
jgi:hypothetical protein